MHISLDGVFERGAGRPSPTSVLVTLRGRARPLASDGPATDLIHDQGVSVSRISIDIRLLSSDISVMTEITAKKKLPAAVERFVLHWGDMGDEWGVNRSVSQIHGLLYLRS